MEGKVKLVSPPQSTTMVEEFQMWVMEDYMIIDDGKEKMVLYRDMWSVGRLVIQAEGSSKGFV